MCWTVAPVTVDSVEAGSGTTGFGKFGFETTGFEPVEDKGEHFLGGLVVHSGKVVVAMLSGTDGLGEQERCHIVMDDSGYVAAVKVDVHCTSIEMIVDSRLGGRTLLLC